MRGAHQAGKPIGLICISPTIGAKVITGSTLTIGTNETIAAVIEKMGSHHQPRQTEEICVDQCNRIVSTPAYMSAERISEVYEGIGKLVERVLQMAQQPAPQPMHADD